MESWGICEQGWRKGPWTPQEDKLLLDYVNQYGDGRWSSVSKCTGLNRSGKSCRLRWVNYLRPGLKKGQLTPQEEGIIIELHALWGNKWSTIARYLPGRTDNEIKNYWRTHFKKRKPTSDDEMMMKQERKRMMRQKVEEITSNKNVDFDQSPDQSISTGDSNGLEVGLFDYQPVENDQFMPVFCDHQETKWCIDDLMSTPLDCYLWDGLWNLDSVQGGTNYYSCEGDGVDYGSLL